MACHGTEREIVQLEAATGISQVPLTLSGPLLHGSSDASLLDIYKICLETPWTGKRTVDDTLEEEGIEIDGVGGGVNRRNLYSQNQSERSSRRDESCNGGGGSEDMPGVPSICRVAILLVNYALCFCLQVDRGGTVDGALDIDDCRDAFCVVPGRIAASRASVLRR